MFGKDEVLPRANGPIVSSGTVGLSETVSDPINGYSVAKSAVFATSSGFSAEPDDALFYTNLSQPAP